MSEGAAPYRLVIEGGMTIRDAHANRDLLLAALTGHEALVLDLAGVSEIDAAGLQILIAAKKSARAASKTLGLADPSRAVLDMIDFLGLTDELGDRDETGDRHEPG